MPDVEIVGPAPSTYTRVARMVCEEKAIPYELKQSLPHSPDVGAIHPFGKVPVMRHGDFELCEFESDRDLSRSQLSRPETHSDRSAPCRADRAMGVAGQYQNGRHVGALLSAELHFSEGQRR